MFKSINGGRLPERATKYSCGFDVFANEDVVIGAGETTLVGLGICLDLELFFKQINAVDSYTLQEDIMNQWYVELHIRSSLRAKGLTSLGTGIIDIDYRDEIKMVIHNPISEIEGNEEGGPLYEYGALFATKYVIKKGDKIGQLILCRHEGWLLPSEYTKDETRNGGFGSTGK